MSLFQHRRYLYPFDGLLVDSVRHKDTKGFYWLNPSLLCSELAQTKCQTALRDSQTVAIPLYFLCLGLPGKKNINYYYLITMVVVFITFRTEQTSHYRRTICNSTSAKLVSYKALTNEVWMALVTFAMTNNLRHRKAKKKLQAIFRLYYWECP